jgi:hypothetical protein
MGPAGERRRWPLSPEAEDGKRWADGIPVELTLIFDLPLIFKADDMSGLLLCLAVILLDICLAFT